MKVVIGHDYLTQRGGAERVVLELMNAFPESEVVTSVYDPDGTYPDFREMRVHTTWLNRVPAFRREPRLALPWLAEAIARVQVPDADVVVCSSSGWAHGLSTTAPKVVYCHNTPRWLYQPEEYLAGQSRPAKAALRVLRPFLTRWDRKQALSAAAYLANSEVVAERVRIAYGRQAQVLNPPRGLDPRGPVEAPKGLEPGFLLTIGRRRGYKHTEVVAKAVAGLQGERLVAVGLSDNLNYPNVLEMSDVGDRELRWLFKNCSGLIACAYEDFGLTPVEAFAFGKPVAALRAGGYLETMLPGVTGVWIDLVSVSAIQDAVRRLRSGSWDPDTIAAHAEQWSPEPFRENLRAFVTSVADEREWAPL